MGIGASTANGMTELPVVLKERYHNALQNMLTTYQLPRHIDNSKQK